jgi:hypothetical protein
MLAAATLQASGVHSAGGIQESSTELCLSFDVLLMGPSILLEPLFHHEMI